MRQGAGLKVVISGDYVKLEGIEGLRFDTRTRVRALYDTQPR
jgi:hypothetical protein